MVFTEYYWVLLGFTWFLYGFINVEQVCFWLGTARGHQRVETRWWFFTFIDLNFYLKNRDLNPTRQDAGDHALTCTAVGETKAQRNTRGGGGGVDVLLLFVFCFFCLFFFQTVGRRFRAFNIQQLSIPSLDSALAS